MKKILSILIILVVVIGGYFLLNKEQTPKNNTGSIKIGALIPLSGNYAVLGERIRNGMELAKEDILVSGEADQIEIIYEDVCLPKDAVSATQKLIQVNKVKFIGASFCLIGLVPSIPIIEENHVIAFNTARNPDSTLNKKYVFSTNTSIKDDAEQIVGYASKNLKAKTAAIIFYNTPFGLDYNKYITQYFEASGGKMLANEMTPLEINDFRTQLSKIKALNPDVLFVVQLANPLGNLIKQTRELGIKATIMGNSENEDPTVLKTAGSAIEGFIITSSEAVKTKKVDDFTKRYEEKYAVEPDIMAANAYDAVWLQVIAYKKCNGDSECIVKELHKVKDYSGVSGAITIKEDGSASKPGIFKIVEDGKFVILNQ